MADVEVVREAKKFVRSDIITVELRVRKGLVFSSHSGWAHSHIGQVSARLSVNKGMLQPSKSGNPMLTKETIAPLSPPLMGLIFNPVRLSQTHLGGYRHDAHRVTHIDECPHLLYGRNFVDIRK